MANVTDSFNRADSSTSMGTADSGQVWAPSSGGVWGIDTNQAYVVSGSQIVTVVETSESDGTINIVVSVAGSSLDAGICFRYADDNNYCMIAFNMSAGLFIAYDNTSGFSEIARSAGSQSVSNGDSFDLVLSGTSIILKQNGTTKLSTTSSAHQTATKHGLRYFSSSFNGHRWDSFSFTGSGGGGGAAAQNLLTLTGVGI